MNVVIIGSGNVASQLAPAIHNAGFNICQVFSRNEQTGSALAVDVNSEYCPTLNDLIVDADLYLVAIPDHAVHSMIAEIATAIEEGAVIAHTTGSLSLDDVSNLHPHVGVFYPLQTFTYGRDINVSEVPLLLEYNSEETRFVLTTIANQVSTHVEIVTSAERRKIHVAAVYSCNFINHLLTTSYSYLKDKGIDSKVLDPLIKETISKFFDKFPSDTQTGPAKRGDLETINKHVAMLEKHPDMLNIYRQFTQQIQDKYHEDSL